MLTQTTKGFELRLAGMLVLAHSAEQPFLCVGCGEGDIAMRTGHFKISENVQKKLPLRSAEIKADGAHYIVSFSEAHGAEVLVRVRFAFTKTGVNIRFLEAKDGFNRFWLCLPSSQEEHIYGCGEQYSYLSLKGRKFPLWVSESGVGRCKGTFVTFMADKLLGAGGDYYTTYYPQPTYVAGGRRIVHLDCSSYMEFDFSHPEETKLYAWAMPKELRIETRESYAQISAVAGEWFGRQPELPEWVYHGVILGVQGGTEAVLRKLKYAEDAGVPVAAVWSQDWQGKRVTKDGKRLFWNWEWNKTEYPGLDETVKTLNARGIRFMGYINPYLATDGTLFKECEEKGFFVRHPQGGTYIVDFGGFTCGMVDFTSSGAFEWYKNVIRLNMIDFGLSGWMADFGEYLPADAVLANGQDAAIMHNMWPVLWARLNREAVDESGKAGELVFFMRSGFTGVQKYCPLLWAGDQCVNFSRHDGLISTVCAALSAGLVGSGLSHSDIGGFTGVPKLLVRSRELFLRWAELSAFTPVMRTHEGILPEDFHQYYDDEKTAAFLAKLARLHVRLAPYIKELVAQNAKHGTPVQRPLFYHYADAGLAAVQDEFLLGADVLVAPVWKKGAKGRRVVLPQDEWVHLFTGETYTGGTVRVRAPLGAPPVFYRKASVHAALFAKEAHGV